MDSEMTTQEHPAAPGNREKAPTVMKALIFLLVVTIIGVGLAIFVLSQRSATGPLVAKEAPDAITVRVVPVELTERLQLSESFTGLATPRRTSMLGFQSGGRIEDVRVDIGSRVKQGQTLAVLDTRSVRAQLVAAQAAVDEARAGRDLAATNAERQKQLFEKGHVAQQRVDEEEARVTTANARINAAQAQADTLKVQIDLARITAPFSGVVTQRMSDEGAIAAPGAPILELVENDHMEARIGLPAKETLGLEIGDTYQLQTSVGPVEAQLRAVTGVIDAGARTVTTVFVIQGDTLPAGSVVRLALDKEIVERGVWIPVGALTEGNRGLWSVYVAQAGDKGWTAQKRPVEIVRAEADRAYIRGALSNGDRVIVEGISRLSPGILVAPTDAEFARSGN